jgi:hypothetical protein
MGRSSKQQVSDMNDKLVIVTVSGGVAEVIKAPKGIKVKIVDWDNDNVCEKCLDKIAVVCNTYSGLLLCADCNLK